MAATDLIAKSLRGGDEPGGCHCSPAAREGVREAAETLDDLAGYLEVVRDAKRLGLHRQGFVDSTLIASECRKLFELGRRDRPVGLFARLTKHVLVTRLTAFHVAQLA